MATARLDISGSTAETVLVPASTGRFRKIKSAAVCVGEGEWGRVTFRHGESYYSLPAPCISSADISFSPAVGEPIYVTASNSFTTCIVSVSYV